MRISACLVFAMLGTSLPMTAFAQATPQPQPITVVPPPNPTATTTVGATVSHWVAAGFLGSNMGGAANDTSPTYGGTVAYLWRGVVGIEGLVDVAPRFKFDNVLLSSDPHVNSYMSNAIVALPIGEKGQFQPFISLGLGGVHLKSSVYTLGAVPTPFTTATSASITTTSADDIRVGSDYGGGVMGFVGRVGIRADVRYYKTTTDDSLTEPTVNPLAAASVDRFNQTLLSGLDFWRANIGAVIRW